MSLTLSDMPTAVKKSPSRMPWNGWMSASSWCRYELSARSAPAMKAPSEADKPAFCIASATATTVSNAAAVIASRTRVMATSRIR